MSVIGLMVLFAAPLSDDEGFLSHELRSVFQAGTTRFRVVLPERFDKDRRYPVIYVLPVEAREGRRFGDGLIEIKKRGLHRRHEAIFVAPTFSHLPWYADHPTKPEIRQESHLLKSVIPAVERLYPVRTTSEGRMLLGFSKSGYGAFSLLLRHPDQFGRALAWDAPMMMDRHGPYGSGEIYGTADNFARYQVTALLARRGPELSKGRLILHGHGNFREQHRAVGEWMKRKTIECRVIDGPVLRHDWHSGWVSPAVDALLDR